jgi:uncharacterized protein YbbK (DUF523 family)
MAVYDQARRIYNILKNNEQALAQIRAEAASLALLIASDPSAGMKIIQGNGNGNSFVADGKGMTQDQRLAMLSIILRFDDNGGALRSTSTTVF